MQIVIFSHNKKVYEIKNSLTRKINRINDKTLNWIEGELRNGKVINVKDAKGKLVSIAYSAGVFVATTSISHAGGFQDAMFKAFQPVIDILQGLAYPLLMVSAVIAGIQIMLGNIPKAMKTIKYAGGGYLAIQLLPVLAQQFAKACEGAVLK